MRVMQARCAMWVAVLAFVVGLVSRPVAAAWQGEEASLAPGSLGEPPYSHLLTCAPPAIEEVTVTPVSPTPGEEITVSARFRPDLLDGGGLIKSASVRFSGDGGESWQEVAMTRAAPGPRVAGSETAVQPPTTEEDILSPVWEAVIPPQAAGAEVLICVSAVDALGNRCVELAASRPPWPPSAETPTGGLVQTMDDPPETSPALEASVDLRGGWLGYDQNYLYAHLATTARPEPGTTDPYYANIYGIAVTGAGRGEDILRRALVYAPLLGAAGLPETLAFDLRSFENGPVSDADAAAAATHNGVSLRCRLAALQAGDVFQAAFLTAVFYTTDFTPRDAGIPTRVYRRAHRVSVAGDSARTTEESSPAADRPALAVFTPDEGTAQPAAGAAAGGTGWNDKAVARIQAVPFTGRFAFVVMGDNHSSDELHAFLLAAADQMGPLLIVNVGDFVNIGTADLYDIFLRQISAVSAPVIPVLGNHDTIGNRDWSVYESVFGKPDFSFDYGNSRFVCLNNVPMGFTEEQLVWLDKALDTDQQHKFVLMHRPPNYIEPESGWTTLATGGAERFKEIVEGRGVDRVFAGHMHLFARTVQGGVTYVVTGGAGASVDVQDPGGFFHFVYVMVDGDKVYDFVVAPNL